MQFLYFSFKYQPSWHYNTKFTLKIGSSYEADIANISQTKFHLINNNVVLYTKQFTKSYIVKASIQI